MLNYVPVDPEQLRQFDDEGYLIVRDVIDTETISQLLEAGDRLLASDRSLNRQRKSDGRYDGFRNCVTMDDAYVSLMTQRSILPLVLQLLGANLQLMTSNVIHRQPDPPGSPRSYRDPGWHRDYLQAMTDIGHYSIPRIELKCAYYLTDLSQPNSGATMVAPRSNQLRELIHIPEGQIDPVNAIEPRLKPGDCLIFENRTWHAGAANQAGRTRKCVMIGYGYRWVMPMDFRKQDPEFIETLSPLERYLVGEPYDDVETYQADGGANPLKAWCLEHDLPTVRHVGPPEPIREGGHSGSDRPSDPTYP